MDGEKPTDSLGAMLRPMDEGRKVPGFSFLCIISRWACWFNSWQKESFLLARRFMFSCQLKQHNLLLRGMFFLLLGKCNNGDDRMEKQIFSDGSSQRMKSRRSRVQRWNSWMAFLVEVSRHKLESSQTRFIVWFSTLIFLFTKRYSWIDSNFLVSWISFKDL